MCCEHCLRGEAQAVDMQRETIDMVLDAVDGIENVLFTGGEPSLNLPLINYFFEKAEKRGKLPSSFSLITNGKENQLDLAMLYLKWFPQMDDKEYCYLAQSQDPFHDEVSTTPLSALNSFTFHKIDPKYVLNEGRAADNGLGMVEKEPLHIYFDNIDDDSCSLEMLYINASGEVVFDCDLSYETQHKVSPCHIEDLRDYIEKAVESGVSA